MKAMLCKAFGPPETLMLEETEPPPLGAADVRVRVRAAGVNFFDTLIIEGNYQVKPSFPFAPGAEMAGEVIEVGAEVTSVKAGERVMSATGHHGAFAEEAVVPATHAIPIPDGMDDETAAAMPIAYGTMAHALIERGALQAGETVLVHGASGGVGLAAVDIAGAMGARVIGTGGDDTKLQVALDHGCEAVINYRGGPFKDTVKELTGGDGADVICDAVGGDVFDQSLRCINWDGRLLVIGFASGRIPEAPANLPLLKSCSIVGVFWGRWKDRDPVGHRRNMERVFAWWKEGKVRPHVSQTFALAEVPAALNALLERKITGKAVVVIGG